LFDYLVQPLPVPAIEIVLPLDSLFPFPSHFLVIRSGQSVHQIHYFLPMFLILFAHPHQFPPRGVIRRNCAEVLEKVGWSEG
jgi:hypothetical protein